MLETAYQLLKEKNGLVIAEVPRWDSLTTAILADKQNSVYRNLDPLFHINVFSDSSLATSFRKANFDIAAVWYFGMDLFELLVQFFHKNTKNNQGIDDFKKNMPALQQQIDNGRLSDTMVLAGKPKL